MGDFSINDLSALSGLPVRTIRYYISQGLIPSAGREGPATRYPESTLARLRLIRKLQDLHLPLAEIRRQLAELPDETVIDLAGSPEAPAPESSALDYVRSLLGSSPPIDAAVAAPPPPPASPPMFAAAPPSMPHRVAEPSEPPLARLAYSMEPPAPAAPQGQTVGDRSQWERISLGPDIELHVRRPLSRRDNRMVERLITFARQLQGGQEP